MPQLMFRPLRLLATACALSWASPASAESPWIPARGQVVAYGGLGLSTFRYGSSGELRDRQLRFRFDGYGAVGLGHRIELAASAPLVMHNTVVDLPDTPPLPCSTDFCANTTTVGTVAVGARLGLGPWPDRLAVGLWAHTDAWNAATRGRWTNAGQGGTGFVGEVVAGAPLGPVELAALGRYDLVIGTPVEVGDHTERLPYDEVAGGLQLGAPLGPLHGELAATGLSRLGGMDWSAEWSQSYPGEWWWSGLRYQELRAQAKLSLPLGERSGLHAYASRVFWVANGPKDAWDSGLGIHHIFGG